MFDKTRDRMNNWWWDNPYACADDIDRCNLQTTRLGMVKHTSERFSWYGRDDHSAKIEPPSCQPYMPRDFLAVRPLNRDEVIDEDDNAENRVDAGAPSGGRS